jgi:hypothetical protein
VAIGSEYLEILAEIFLDGFGFGGRLYNDQVHPFRLFWHNSGLPQTVKIA